MTAEFCRNRAHAAMVCAISALAGVLAAGATAQGDPAAGPPRVLRTFTHHQITAVDPGLWGRRPVVSDSGNRIVFTLRPVAEGQPLRLAAIDFDGGAPVVLDAAPGLGQADITADGSRIVYVADNEIRIVNPDGSGRRTVFKPYDGVIDCLRISGDGRVIVFLNARGMLLGTREKNESVERGVFAIDPDGSRFRRVSGPEAAAGIRGVQPSDVGNPNFTLDYREGSLDVSTNGGRIVFGCWAGPAHVLFGCDGNGGGLHIVDQRPVVSGGLSQQFNSIALSGDGTTVAWQTVYPNELGVTGFDGGGARSLLRQGPEDRRLGWGSSAPVFITLDGARVTYEGRLFDARGTGILHLLYAHQEGVLRYSEYEQMSPDGTARRFAYWPYQPQPLQLATMELNVPADRLRGAPRVSDLVVDPPAIPRQVPDVAISLPRLAARVLAGPPAPTVSSSGFWLGLVDEKMAQYGRVGQTDLYDDGKTVDSGDLTPGDGIYSRRWLAVYPDAPDGPRTVRLEAQTKGTDGFLHASVVEIGPYPIVPGSKEPLPVGTTPTIDGRPPEPPTVMPRPSDSTTPPPTITTDPPGPTGPDGPPKPGAIDLTGYWVSESGALHFVRQIGKNVYWSVDFLPRVRNIFMGSIEGDVLTGAWIDLPGGEIETGTGILKLKIESNDRLTKVSASVPYDAAVWTRVGKPSSSSSGSGSGPAGPGGPGATGGPGVPGSGIGPGGPVIAPPGVKPEPWQTPEGRALIDQWAAEAMTKLNVYDGGAAFNRRKPFSINRYGLLAGTGLSSVAAPDGFQEHGNDRYWFMWDYWIPDPGGWRYPEWNAAGVPALRSYVESRLAAK